MEKKYARFATKKIQTDSIVDGEGIRSVIWFQGCSHNCPGCHNPETHDFNSGELVDLDEMKKQIDELEYQAGVTFSGGDPMMQVEALTELAAYVKSKGMNVWCYTGYTFEELLDMSDSNPYIINFLKNIDVLVDGEYQIENNSPDKHWVGSSNQRVIDVSNTMDKGEIILWQD